MTIRIEYYESGAGDGFHEVGRGAHALEVDEIQIWTNVDGVMTSDPRKVTKAFTIPFLGVGRLPAVVALWVYAIFPILRNTYTGVRDASPEGTLELPLD